LKRLAGHGEVHIDFVGSNLLGEKGLNAQKKAIRGGERESTQTGKEEREREKKGSPPGRCRLIETEKL